MSGWPLRRSLLVHGEIGNRLFPALLVAEEGEVEGSSAQCGPLAEELAEWAAVRAKLESLVRSFEAEMSPATIVDRWVAEGIDGDEVRWMRDLIDEDWRRRLKVPTRRAAALSALEGASRAIDRVRQTTVRKSEERRAVLRAAEVALRKLCDELGEFPRWIVV